jgi:hypothetical protein
VLDGWDFFGYLSPDDPDPTPGETPGPGNGKGKGKGPGKGKGRGPKGPGEKWGPDPVEPVYYPTPASEAPASEG